MVEKSLSLSLLLRGGVCCRVLGRRRGEEEEEEEEKEKEKEGQGRRI